MSSPRVRAFVASPSPGSGLANVHSLRSYDQALAIAEDFASGKRLVVVGGGFIGLEIAASARLRDLETTVVEASDRLLARVVPARIASLLARRHEEEGVTLRMGAMVERFISNGRGAVKAAELSTGETIPCDVAVVGVGVAANVELAAEAGLDVDVGIRADASLRTSDPAIFAIGDVANFWHPLYDRPVRVEAWQNAEDHAKVAAAVLSGREAVADTVPFFWSDQYDLSLQIVGLPHLGSSVVARTRKDGAAILFHLEPNGRIVGATGLGTGRVDRPRYPADAGAHRPSCPSRPRGPDGPGSAAQDAPQSRHAVAGPGGRGHAAPRRRRLTSSEDAGLRARRREVRRFGFGEVGRAGG